MRFRHWLLPTLALCAAGLVAQEAFDRDYYARAHVKFLVEQLDQWSREFPQQFNAALMKPPVDASKLSEAAKSGPSEFGESIKRMVALTSAKDLTTNPEFRNLLEKTVSTMKEVNLAMSSQRFPAVLQS